MCHGQVLGDALLRARKTHRCSDCHLEIPAGRVYRRQRWIGERGDKPETLKWCRRCYALRRQESDASGDGCSLGLPREYGREIAKDIGWRAMLADLRQHVAGWTRKKRGGAA